MAPSGCELDDGELAEQLARYRHLSASVLTAERADLSARVLFSDQVDTALLDQTLTIERGCCSFFALDYDESRRTLSISTEPERAEALLLLLGVLAPEAAGR